MIDSILTKDKPDNLIGTRKFPNERVCKEKSVHLLPIRMSF